MLARTSSTSSPSEDSTVPNFMVYPLPSAILPFLHVMTLSAIDSACGPLTLITEIAPVPGVVAGAHIVSSFRIYIFSSVITELPRDFNPLFRNRARKPVRRQCFSFTSSGLYGRIQENAAACIFLFLPSGVLAAAQIKGCFL